jgi:hypothetical protein
MSIDNVTPIRPEATKPPRPPRKRGPRAPKAELSFEAGTPALHAR